ncbi:MAG TPA: glycosyltransferase family 2 protein [Vicinamibacteria bacterium]|nr:glycosyltransferase family 2 protein [Vicinamibacteria bacterium]
MSTRPLVSIGIVTYNSENEIRYCLESIHSQTYEPLEVVVIDNASKDRTVSLIRSSGIAVQLSSNERNLGFAAAQNQAIRLTRGDYYLALNPDVVMAPDFVAELVECFTLHAGVGTASGKLLRPAREDSSPLLDSTGIYMSPNLRHLDRGSGQIDVGQYDRPQFVFGASGAAALYARSMLDDVALDGEFFDEDFFAYREDADLAWRAQLRGWKALYTPRAVAFHSRRVLPERRRSLPSEINMHSVKNRFLLRIKNQTPYEFVTLFFPSLFRDLQVLGYVLLFERTSLPGLFFVARNFRRTWGKRRQIMSRRRTKGRDMLRWFRRQPVAFEMNIEEESKSAALKTMTASG